ncbi:MAG: type II toxin-antitoxin system RelE/ParE family toxin [Rhodoferax sp.]|nr:type II toxin-antitoxin system RelE/ParE family toxin [Rhodoferax sp.]
MNRTFKTRYFAKWMGKTELTNDALCAAVTEMIAGLVDADLGGGVIKKRIGLAGHGKRGGARTLIATRQDNRWFFVFGFEKNDRANISHHELEALQDLAQDLLTRTDAQLDTAVQAHTLEEICHDQ